MAPMLLHCCATAEEHETNTKTPAIAAGTMKAEGHRNSRRKFMRTIYPSDPALGIYHLPLMQASDLWPLISDLCLLF
jgi:hypothetical protein